MTWQTDNALQFGYWNNIPGFYDYESSSMRLVNGATVTITTLLTTVRIVTPYGEDTEADDVGDAITVIGNGKTRHELVAPCSEPFMPRTTWAQRLFGGRRHMQVFPTRSQFLDVPIETIDIRGEN